jgi:hypothetical protein
MSTRLAFASVASLALLAFAAGCGAAPSGEPAPESAESALHKSALVFRGQGLEIKVEVLPGLKSWNQNRRYIGATVSRGTNSFFVFCDLRGRNESGQKTTRLGCSEYAETVSNDDDESLEFTIEQRGNSYRLDGIGYMGDGTIYGDHVEILTGGGVEDFDLEDFELPLTVQRPANMPLDKDPFAIAGRVHGALDDLRGESFWLNDLGVKVNVAGYTAFTIDDAMEMTVEVAVGKQASRRESLPGGKISLLQTAGNPKAGLASASTISSRAVGTLR